MITITALARELDVTIQDVLVYVDQLISIDGHEAVIAQETPIYDGSNRIVGSEVTLTDEAEEALREQFASLKKEEEEEPEYPVEGDGDTVIAD